MVANFYEIKDLTLFIPKVHNDERGYFMESYKKEIFDKLLGKNIDFIQDNEAKSTKNTLRGLHYQKPPFAQTKLIRCVSGCILDIVVDLRMRSDTFGESKVIELSDSNKHQLLVPTGFAHGYFVKSEIAIVNYKVDNVYSPAHESGLKFDDQDIYENEDDDEIEQRFRFTTHYK